MSHLPPAAPTPRPTLIRTPDQLQQARRPDVAAAPAPAEPVRPDDAGPPLAGVLLQLQSERAHG